MTEKPERKRKEGQEDLEDVVDELKNDLQLIEDDYEILKQSYAKLEAENKRLRELLDRERSDKQVIEVKLKKNAIHHELKDNQALITNNTFFEAKRSKLASLNTTLLTTVSQTGISYMLYLDKRVVQDQLEELLCR